jgi:hypothetical protein
MPTLKQWIDEHPARVILAIALSVGSAASGATAYILNQKHDLERGETARGYNEKISDLTTRLSSIERRASATQERKYLDVQAMQITFPDVRSLSASFKDIDGGRLFVSAPIMDEWSFSVSTEGEVAKTGPMKQMIEGLENNNEKFKKAMSSKAYFWHPKPIASVEFTQGFGANKLPTTGLLTPHVMVVPIAKGQLAEKVASFYSSEKKSKTTGNVPVEPAAKPQESTADGSAAEKKASQSTELSDADQKLILEQLFDGDEAGVLMLDSMMRMASLGSAGSNFSYRINSAQKQLNVMYVDGEIEISDVTITNSSDEYCTNGISRVVTLRREYFFVSHPRGSYLIETEVPTCGGRSRAFDWISQWLAGLRIAVRT